MLARLAAWIDRMFWPGLDERASEPAWPVSSLIVEIGDASYHYAGPLTREQSDAAHWDAYQRHLDMVRRVDRARSLRVSLC